MRDYDGRKSPIITRERRSIELNTRDCFYVRFPHKTVENSTLETVSMFFGVSPSVMLNWFRNVKPTRHLNFERLEEIVKHL